MRQVKFLRQFTCAPDGAVTRKFKAGETSPPLSDALADSAINSGAAEEVAAVSEEAPAPKATKKKAGKKKAKKKAPENKATGGDEDK